MLIDMVALFCSYLIYILLLCMRVCMCVLCVLFFCIHLINKVIFICFQLLGQGISLTIFALFSLSLDYTSL